MVKSELSDSDFEDDELDRLYQKNINKNVTETITKRSVPVQRDLYGNVLPDECPYYEEIERVVTFGATHHKLKLDQLKEYIYPTNYEVREYQFNIVNRALFENVLCAIPTGMGKTFIASTVMLNYFRWSATGKIIFTAPTRPLVAQQIKACLGITGIPHDQAAILLDKSRRNREEIWKDKRVFFTTPQVIENDLKRGVLNPKDIICLVIDEAHRATGSYAYTEVVKFIDKFNSSYRILALTATPGADIQGVQDVVDNLNISRIEVRTEESMDIVKYMKKRYKEKIEAGSTSEIETIIEQLGIAINPVLQQAIELEIFDPCPPSHINAFQALQKSQQIIANTSIPEGIKWRNFFILQLLNHVGQMLKRIKIYGIRTFYNYFKNKFNEFTTKYSLGKSTNKIAAGFYYHPMLTKLMKSCEEYVSNAEFLGHEKLRLVKNELEEFFISSEQTSRVIVFTELRESALEIVKCIDSMENSSIKPHIFIGQARAKENFDEVEYIRKNKPKGRKKEDRLKRLEENKTLAEEKHAKKLKEQSERSARRTASSEEAQILGMHQKQQKEVLQKFKQGIHNVLVCTSIGEEGLDIGEVDLIICYDTTSSPIKNIQRMGRTGRKRDGRIILLFSANESRKFEKAMEDYYNLQKVIGQNFVNYHKSDRIIPENVQPVCKKEFIVVSSENEQLNEMQDSDEVIRYATQCMLGKKPKVKKERKKQAKGSGISQKRFFMPDNVVTGIVTASSLVKKVSNEMEKQIKESEFKRECLLPDKDVPFLDAIIKDSFDSSPIKFEHDDNLKLIDQHKSGDCENIDRYHSKVANNDFKVSNQSQNLVQIAISKYETNQSKIIGNSTEDEKMVQTESTSFSSPIFDDVKCQSSKITIFDRNSFSHEEGLLTVSEKLYFKDHYSNKSVVSIEAIPFLDNKTKHIYVDRNLQTGKMMDLFKDINHNKNEFSIKMSRIKCKARETNRMSISDAKCGQFNESLKSIPTDRKQNLSKQCNTYQSDGYEPQITDLGDLLSSDIEQ